MKNVALKLVVVVLCFLIMPTFKATTSADSRQQTPKISPAAEQPHKDPINVTFRLLAIEGYYSVTAKTADDFDAGADEPMKSAQYLIDTLTGERLLTTLNNWQNGTTSEDGNYSFTTHIHLLSADPNANATFPSYYKGLPTNSNVVYQIETFLAATQSPWESNSLTVRILYYCGHSTVRQAPVQYVNQGSNGFFLCLGKQGSDPALGAPPTTNPTSYQELWDFQLNQLLNYGDLATSNCTLVILDSCHSGAAIGALKKPGRVILTSCNATQLSQGWLSAPKAGTLDHWSWFTGQDANDAYHSNGAPTETFGIIGALLNGTADSNKDGWLDSDEIFNFAMTSTCKYAFAERGICNMPADPQIPQEYLGAKIPIAEYCMRGPGISDFPYNSRPFIGNLVAPVNTWSGYHDDSSRTGTTTSDGPSSNNLNWSHAGYGTNASIIVGEWEAIVATNDGAVHGLDLTTGNENWRFATGSQITSTPSVDKGILYVATMGGGGGGGGAGGILYAIDEGTGRVRWKYQAPTNLGFYASPAVADGFVYVATTSQTSMENWVCAFNQTSGQQLWNSTVYTSVKSSPAVADGCVYVATTAKSPTNAVLYAFAESSGVPLWEYTFSGFNNIVSTPAVAAGMVFVECMGGGGGGGAGLYAFQESGPIPPNGYSWYYPTSNPVSSSPAVDETRGIIVGCSQGGNIYGLNLAGGVLWLGPPESVVMSSPAISGNGLVYVGTTDGKVLCLNETSGLIVWSYTTGGSVASSPAISENHVLVGTTGTALYSFGPPFPDIALTSVTLTQTCAVEGCLVNVTVVVRNKGEFTETLNITLYANSIPIQTVQVTLAGNSSADVNFRDGLLRGTFLLSAYATPVKYEKDIYNNAAVGGFVKISPIPLTKSLTRKTTLL